MFFFRIFENYSNKTVRIKFFLILLTTTAYVQAQMLVFPFHHRFQTTIEQYFHNDSSLHPSIKPYLTNVQLLKNKFNFSFQSSHDTTKGFYIEPLIHSHYQSFNHWYFSGGFEAGGFWGKKLSFIVQPRYFSIKPDSIMMEKYDSIGILSGIGKINRTSGWWQKLAITGNIHWQTFSFLSFDVGIGKHFLGEGDRSLFLSDNSAPYPYIRGMAKKWKVQYIVLYSFYREPIWKNFNQPYTRKNSTLHYISWHINKRFTLHAFETVIWQVRDSIGNRGFDINYLNPIVFYRPIEFSLGSPDNVMMGAGFALKVFKQSYIYGQFLLDEFKLSEWKAKQGWWGNKFGFQTGIKTYQLFDISSLFFRLECNVVRPFTYAHSDYLSTWGAMHEPLAHPLGANFIEWLSQISYSYKRWFVAIYANYYRQGEGNTLFNAGNNLYQSYNQNRQEYGNYLLIGSNTTVKYASFIIAYTLKPSWELNLFVKTEYLTKHQESKGTNDYLFVQLGINTRRLFPNRW